MSTEATAIAVFLLVFVVAGLVADRRVRRRGEDAAAIARIFESPYPAIKPGDDLACSGRVPR